jgi:phage-related baseplate assembly protein
MANGTVLAEPGFNWDFIPHVDFAKKDPTLIRDEALTDYQLRFQALTGIGKILGPADPTRLLLLTGIYWIVHDRVDIDFTGKMNLLKYSRGDYLDNLGALYGDRAKRLKGAFADTILRFTLTAPLPFTAMIPVDTRVTSNGEIIFHTTRADSIPSGQIAVDIPAHSTEMGTEFNNIPIGAISALVDWNQPFAVTVSNIEPTTGGAGREDDEHYRDRLRLVPESFSTCGPELAYEFWAKTAHPDIIDCAVHSAPEIAGEVHLFPLMRDGELPTPAILQDVLEICSQDRRRPLTDYVFAQLPQVVEFELQLTVWLWRSRMTVASEILSNVRRAVDRWLFWQRTKVGRDIIPTQLIRWIQEAGVKRVAVRAPEEGWVPPAMPPIEPGQIIRPEDLPPMPQVPLVRPSPPFTPLAFNQVAHLRGDPIINFGGFEDEYTIPSGGLEGEPIP